MNSYKWMKKENSGHVPAGRDDFGMSLDGDNLYVFGGFVSGVWHNDLYCYNFTTNKWECLFANHPYHELEESKDFPVPRSGLAMGASGSSIIIFGGWNDFNDMLEDTWEFNIGTKTWTKIVGDNHPVGRSSHSLTLEGEWLILFGGIVDITKEINELHMFDFASKTWKGVDDNVEHPEGYEYSPSP